MIDYNDLSERAKRIRRNIVKMIYKAQSGHLGGSLSCGMTGMPSVCGESPRRA